MRRTCPAPACGVPIPPPFFLCREHWRSLEDTHREAVGAAFKAYERAKKWGSGLDITEAGQVLREAQAAALDSLTPAPRLS